MAERMTRDRIIDLLRALPPDATLDDALEELAFLSEIERGMANSMQARACCMKK
jgi:hypothetical protein